MLNRTVQAAAKGSPNSSELSRRNVLKPLAAGLVAAAAMVPLASAAEPDPIFALIEQHRAARELWWALDATPWNCRSPEEVAACDAEYGAFQKFLTTKPRTLAGIAAFAAHASDGWPHSCLPDDDADQALATIAEALRDILSALMRLTCAT